VTQRRINDVEKQHRARCYRDFEYYAPRNLSIRPKEGDLKPFKLNAAQLYVHNKLEKQLAETGKIRAIILKGRQQGMSTYIEGRFYWETTRRKGVRAFILAHESDSTNSLFTMAKRFYDNCPTPMRPALQTSNAKELIFSQLDSGYKIGTAGNESVGRSQTNQFFHGSEVGFWKNTSELVKGVLQTVPDMDGTSVIYESTANGVGNFLHQQCIAAMKGEGEFQFIFVPWFWQTEYVKAVPDDFEYMDDEHDLIERFGPDGMTVGHLMWRRNKIVELSTDGADGGRAFKQEYPNDPHEAFQVTGNYGLITPECVMRARKEDKVIASGPLVVGIDPSRGGDRFMVVRRKGRMMYGFEGHVGDIPLGKQVSICRKILDEEAPARMFIDMGNMGASLVDRLIELNYGHVVRGIWFGGAALDPIKFKNKRAEMGGNLRAWLNDESLTVSIPDEDAIQADFCIPQIVENSMDTLQLESKKVIKKRTGISTDMFDAAGLTLAEPVRDGSARQMKVKRQYNG
jgi:hypothetical protein